MSKFTQMLQKEKMLQSWVFTAPKNVSQNLIVIGADQSQLVATCFVAETAPSVERRQTKILITSAPLSNMQTGFTNLIKYTRHWGSLYASAKTWQNIVTGVMSVFGLKSGYANYLPQSLVHCVHLCSRTRGLWSTLRIVSSQRTILLTTLGQTRRRLSSVLSRKVLGEGRMADWQKGWQKGMPVWQK